jgi:hypothetical protein
MISVATLLSVLTGVLVGVLVHDASLGIAASNGLAAVLSCVEVHCDLAAPVMGEACDRIVFYCPVRSMSHWCSPVRRCDAVVSSPVGRKWPSSSNQGS